MPTLCLEHVERFGKRELAHDVETKPVEMLVDIDRLFATLFDDLLQLVGIRLNMDAVLFQSWVLRKPGSGGDWEDSTNLPW